MLQVGASKINVVSAPFKSVLEYYARVSQYCIAIMPFLDFIRYKTCKINKITIDTMFCRKNAFNEFMK